MLFLSTGTEILFQAVIGHGRYNFFFFISDRFVFADACSLKLANFS